MNVIVFAGFSGSGKTTLLEQVIPIFRLRGFHVCVLKHAHHQFDIDHVGKDSWRHREAGAHQVLIANEHRFALLNEWAEPNRLNVHELLNQFSRKADWIFIEGFKECDLPKIEIWRKPNLEMNVKEHAVLYPKDDHIKAIATDVLSINDLPYPTKKPLLNINDPNQIANWLLDENHVKQFEYKF